jgi:1,4-dihydroxy-2-naphthoate polyprenyltransferase
VPVVLGDTAARVLNRAIVAGMYVAVGLLVVTGTISVLTAVAVAALPRAVRAVALMGQPRPPEPPAGYVGWPLWYHQTCFVHNRLFGWLYIAGLAGGALLGLRIAIL